MAFGVDDAVNVAATIANTVAGISDMNKRRVIEENLALMSDQDKVKLAKQIAAQNNTNARATILINTIMAARDAAATREQRSQTIKWILIGVFGLGTLVTIAWYLKKR